MPIKKIRVSNFKSFNNLEVELGPFNVLIGANASGKSNFVQIFNFWRDIQGYELESAISLQGGLEFFRNMNIAASKNFSFEIYCDSKESSSLTLPIGDMLFNMISKVLVYELKISFGTDPAGFGSIEDKATFQETDDPKSTTARLESRQVGDIGSNEQRILRTQLGISRERPPFPFPINELIPLGFSIPRLLRKRCSFSTSDFGIFGDISIYDFDPKIPKKARPIVGKLELEEDGGNLSLVLRKIMASDDSKRVLLNLLTDILPFIRSIATEPTADKSMLFKIEEAYSENNYLPSAFVSDGTINVIALIVALYFEKNDVIIIEEPERNIHPSLISKVVSMMKDASRQKQIIVTTHNPEIVRHAGIENLLLIQRDKDGFSQVTRPADNEAVKTFLANDMGIDELYVQNLLGI